MYIRCTSTRSNATGESYFTYRLVSSERIDGKVKHVTLLNLGRHFAVDPSLWPAVCRRVTDLMTGQASLLDPALTKVAARETEPIAAQLLVQRAGVSGLEAEHLSLGFQRFDACHGPARRGRRYTVSIDRLPRTGQTPLDRCRARRLLGHAASGFS